MLHLTENQEKRCKELMTDKVIGLIKKHARDIIRTTNEIYDESEGGNASLDVPITLRVKYDDEKGYTFGTNIEVKKVTKIKDTSDPVSYNPQIPDLPGFEDGNIPEGLGDNGQTFFFVKGNPCPIIDRDTEFETEGWINIGKPINQGKIVNAIKKDGFKYRVLRGDYDGEICYQLQKKKLDEETKSEEPEAKEEKPVEAPQEAPAAEEKAAPEVPVEEAKQENAAIVLGDIGNEFIIAEGVKIRIFDKDKLTDEAAFINNNPPVNTEALSESELIGSGLEKQPTAYTIIRGAKKDTGEIRYFLCCQNDAPAAEQPKDESKDNFELCGHPHADGQRFCTRAKGHDGRHSYGPAKQD
jgi:hypothetical protein